MNEREQAQGLSRNAKTGAVSLMAAAVVLLVVSLLGVLSLAKTRSDLQIEADSLGIDVTRLQVVRDSLVADTISLNKRLRNTLDVVSGSKADPFTDSVSIHASYRMVPNEYTDGGKQKYLFWLWVTAPAAILQSIAKVDYRYDYPNGSQYLGYSRNRESGFKLDYDGSGSFDVITVTIYRTNGTSLKRSFAMAESLVPE